MTTWRQQLNETYRQCRIKARDELSSDSSFLSLSKLEQQSFISSVAAVSLMKEGYVPSTFTYFMDCKKCGRVPIDYVVEGPVLACVWCNNNATPEIYVADL